MKYNNLHTQKGAAKTWIVALVAILALVLAAVAFHRTGNTIIPVADRNGEVSNQETDDSSAAREEESSTGNTIIPDADRNGDVSNQETDDSSVAREEESDTVTSEKSTEDKILEASVQAQADLFALQASLTDDASYENAQQDLAQIKDNLTEAYANTSGDLQAEYQDTMQELEIIEESISNGTEDVAETILEFAAQLEANL